MLSQHAAHHAAPNRGKSHTRNTDNTLNGDPTAEHRNQPQPDNTTPGVQRSDDNPAPQSQGSMGKAAHTC